MPYTGNTKLDYYYNDRLNQAIGMGDLWSTIGQIANRVASAARTVEAAAPYAGEVASGRAAIAVVPKGQSTFVTPVPGTSVAFGLPTWVIPAAIGGVVLLLVMRSRR